MGSEKNNESLLKKKILPLVPLHSKVGMKIINADNRKMFPLDLLAIGVLNRSFFLTKGFSSMVASENIIAAAPLIRMQLDNCLRFYAAWLAEDPHVFATNVLKGIPVKKQKDRDGAPMTDAYLITKLMEAYPEATWIREVYTQTSGYVHLSEKHMMSSVSNADGNGKFSMMIGGTEHIPQSVYEEAVAAFEAITEKLFHLALSWAQTKDNPKKNNQDDH